MLRQLWHLPQAAPWLVVAAVVRFAEKGSLRQKDAVAGMYLLPPVHL